MSRLLGIGCLVALAVFWTHETGARAEDERPNILIIVTDDHREGLEVMPELRKWFGADGTLYSQAFATTPLCCPARASLMTGRFAHNNGVKNNSAISALNHQTTLPYYLKSAGYRTGIFGKLFNRWKLSRNPPYYDRWAIFPQSNAGTYQGANWNIQGIVKKQTQYATRFISQSAKDFIGDTSPEPWYLYLSTPNAHAPYKPETQYSSASVGAWSGNPAVFETDKSDKPPYVRASSKGLTYGKQIRTKQLRTLLSVDDMIAEVMTTLRDTGELDNTLAFVVSDHGLFWGEHGLQGKNAPYTQAVLAPMLARWPGHLASGATDERLVAHLDIAPTALEAAGVTPAVPMDGRSLLAPVSRNRLLLEYFKDPYSAIPSWASTVFDNGAQYTEYYDDSRTVTFREYYAHDDPWQLENVFANAVEGDEPANAAELHDQLELDSTCSGASCP